MLSAAVCASALTWLAAAGDQRCSPTRRAIRAMLAGSETLDRPRRRRSTRAATTCAGREDAAVTLVEYGDFECPYCGRAEPVMRELLADFGDVRYVWRHLPLSDVHPNAQLAAEAAEAAAAQGAFWEMHDLLLDHQGDLRPARPARLRRAAGARRRALRRGHPAARQTPRGSRKTSTPPTPAASPARRPSSSTSAATTAPTTSRPSRRRSGKRGRDRRSRPPLLTTRCLPGLSPWACRRRRVRRWSSAGPSTGIRPWRRGSRSGSRR